MELSKSLRNGAVGLGIALAASQGGRASGQELVSPLLLMNAFNPMDSLSPADSTSPKATPAQELERQVRKVGQALEGIQRVYGKILEGNSEPRGLVAPEMIQKRLAAYSDAR